MGARISVSTLGFERAVASSAMQGIVISPVSGYLLGEVVPLLGVSFPSLTRSAIAGNMDGIAVLGCGCGLISRL